MYETFVDLRLLRIKCDFVLCAADCKRSVIMSLYGVLNEANGSIKDG